MSNLSPLDSIHRCVKCGYQVTQACSTEYSTVENWTAAGTPCYKEDHLRRTCRRCGYTWKEACLDAE